MAATGNKDEIAPTQQVQQVPTSTSSQEVPNLVSEVNEPQKRHWWHSIKGKKNKDETAVTEQLEPTNTASSQLPEPLPEENKPKERWYHSFKEPGSALQIISAALVAIAIGLAVAMTVDDVPEAARVIISIPGDLWLRSLKAVGKPLTMKTPLIGVC